MTWKRSGSSEVMKTLTPGREKRWMSEYMYSRKRMGSPGGELEVGEAVDQDAPRTDPFDRFEQVVDPFVDVDVDRRAVHDLDARSSSDQPKLRDDPLELGRVLLQRGDHAGLALARRR